MEGGEKGSVGREGGVVSGARKRKRKLSAVSVHWAMRMTQLSSSKVDGDGETSVFNE